MYWMILKTVFNLVDNDKVDITYERCLSVIRACSAPGLGMAHLFCKGHTISAELLHPAAGNT